MSGDREEVDFSHNERLRALLAQEELSPEAAEAIRNRESDSAAPWALLEHPDVPSLEPYLRCALRLLMPWPAALSVLQSAQANVLPAQCRERAAWVLADDWWEDPTRFPLLVSALTVADDRVFQTVCEELESRDPSGYDLPKQTVLSLQAALTHEPMRGRIAAATVLWLNEDTSDVVGEVVRAALVHTDLSVRRRAAYTLLKAEARRICSREKAYLFEKELACAVGDDDPLVRYCAAVVLGCRGIPVPAAVPAVLCESIYALEGMRGSPQPPEDPWWNKCLEWREHFRALSTIGPPAVSHLLDALSDYERWPVSEDIILCLLQMGEKILPALLETISGRPAWWSSPQFLYVLAIIGDQDYVLDALRDPRGEVRLGAAKALGKGHPAGKKGDWNQEQQARAALQQALVEEPEEEIRKALATILACCGQWGIHALGELVRPGTARPVRLAALAGLAGAARFHRVYEHEEIAMCAQYYVRKALDDADEEVRRTAAALLSQS